MADLHFVCNTEALAQALAENGNQVYRYYYAHRSSTDPWPRYTGVKHGDEIEFFFGHALTRPASYAVEEISFAQDVITYLTNFVRTGSPNPAPFLNIWPNYKSPDWRFMKLTAAAGKEADGDRIGAHEMADSCQFWNEVIPEIQGELDVGQADTITFDECRA